MRWTGLLAALALVAGPAAGRPLAYSPPRLTAEGWGGLRVGMAEADAVRRFRLHVEQADDADCHVLFSADSRLMVMIRDGKVGSVAVFGLPRILTDRGLHIGSTEAEVRRAYGAALKVEPNPYDDTPAHYLTWWAAPGRRGIMYETDAKGRVTDIHAGDETIGWTDGCG